MGIGIVTVPVLLPVAKFPLVVLFPVAFIVYI